MSKRLSLCLGLAIVLGSSVGFAQADATPEEAAGLTTIKDFNSGIHYVGCQIEKLSAARNLLEAARAHSGLAYDADIDKLKQREFDFLFASEEIGRQLDEVQPEPPHSPAERRHWLSAKSQLSALRTDIQYSTEITNLPNGRETVAQVMPSVPYVDYINFQLMEILDQPCRTSRRVFSAVAEILGEGQDS